MRFSGTILRFNKDGGFGFIEPAEPISDFNIGTRDVFFHHSQLPGDERFSKTLPGKIVSFEVEEFKNRPVAMRIAIEEVRDGE